MTDNLATKEDIGTLKEDIEALRLATKEDIGALRSDMQKMEISLHKEMQELRFRFAKAAMFVWVIRRAGMTDKTGGQKNRDASRNQRRGT